MTLLSCRALTSARCGYTDQHTLCNADGTLTAYPNAAATYKADWGLGQ